MTRWMVQQRDLLFSCSQPFGLDGCLQQMDLFYVCSQPSVVQLDTEQMDLLEWLDTCIVQMDAVADGLVTCMWTLYLNVTMQS